MKIFTSPKEMIDRIALLEAELAACRKDAERYRWLRDCTGDYESDEAHRITHSAPACNWDRAIDEAMEKP